MRQTATRQGVADIDRRNVLHPFSVLSEHERTGPRRVIVSGEGVRVTDEDGRRYIDAMAGLWCTNVGYGRSEIADAMRDQAVRLHYYHGFSSMATDAPALLAERILSVAPAGMSKVFYGSGGSDANDSQIKLVRLYNNLRGRPEKKKIVARDRGYHGVSLASASLTGLPSLHASFDLPLPGFLHTRAPYPLWEANEDEDDAAFSARLARELDELIEREGPDTVAAFIAEPVQAAGGVIVPPAGYFEAIEPVLRRHDVLLIADEVVTGFGRVGAWFASERFGIKPDLITVAKGITSAYAPLSACIVSEEVWRVLSDDGGARAFGHGYTYTAHPVCAAAALANLDILEREELLERAAASGELMLRRLRETVADNPYVAEVRGTGLLAAIEFVAQREPRCRFEPVGSFAAQVTRECLERGVITRALPEADTISFSPPFIISAEEIEEVVTVVGQAVDAVSAEAAAQSDHGTG
jgi:L-2,4-diaminobutyrate transaminase